MKHDIQIEIESADRLKFDFPDSEFEGYYLYVTGEVIEEDLYDSDIDMLLCRPGFYKRLAAMHNGNYQTDKDTGEKSIWFDKYDDVCRLRNNIIVYMRIMHGVIVN